METISNSPMTNKNYFSPSSTHSSVITEERNSYEWPLSEQIRRRCHEWCLISSIHGLSNLVRSLAYRRFLFWLISFTICLILCIALVVSNFLNYFSYEVVSKARNLAMSPDEYFPVVSVCNENPFTSPADNQFVRDFFRLRYNINVSTYGDVLDQLGPVRSQAAYQEILYLIGLPAELNLTTATFGYSAQDVVAKFEFDGKPMSVDDLETFLDPNYGRCFRFNSDASSTRRRHKMFSLGQGLRMDLFLGVSDQVHEYMYAPPRIGLHIEIKGIVKF